MLLSLTEVTIKQLEEKIRQFETSQENVIEVSLKKTLFAALNNIRTLKPDETT